MLRTPFSDPVALHVPAYLLIDPPSSQAPPTVSGTGAPGQPLTCAPGTWSGADTFDFLWLRDGAPIPGAITRSGRPRGRPAAGPGTDRGAAMDASGRVEAPHRLLLSTQRPGVDCAAQLGTSHDASAFPGQAGVGCDPYETNVSRPLRKRRVGRLERTLIVHLRSVAA